MDAGHGLAFVVRDRGALERLDATSVPLGIPGAGGDEVATIRLDARDALVCISDGILDALGGDRALPRLEAIVRSSATAAGAVSRIVGAARAGLPIDDMTAVVVRRADA